MASTLRNSGSAYGRVARFFHWLMAALLLWQFSIAVTMVRVLPEGDWQHRAYNWHEWSGVTLFALVTARLIWRLLDKPPPLDVPAPMRLGAQLVHLGLYVLLFVMPITGYAANNALGFSMVLYGFIPLPDLLTLDRPLGFRLLALHFWLGMTLLALFCLHVGGALLHHFVLRDGTLSRMWPRMPPRR
jgi:cytochrome b561